MSTDIEQARQQLAIVEQWLIQSNGQPPALQQGSDFDTDRRRCQIYQPYQAAYGSWISAVEHLEVVRQQLLAGPIYTFSPYSLLRAALENAALTVWLTAPDSSDERLTRRLKLAWDEAGDVGNLPADLLGDKPGKDERHGQIRALATELGLPLDPIAGRFSWQRMVGRAAEHLPAQYDLAKMWAETLWQMCSGMTHGRDWARQAWLEVEYVAVDGDEATISLTSDVNRILVIANTAVAMAHHGRALIDRRRLRFTDHPAPSPPRAS